MNIDIRNIDFEGELIEVMKMQGEKTGAGAIKRTIKEYPRAMSRIRELTQEINTQRSRIRDLEEAQHRVKEAMQTLFSYTK